jgi:hypothetical protein
VDYDNCPKLHRLWNRIYPGQPLGDFVPQYREQVSEKEWLAKGGHAYCDKEDFCTPETLSIFNPTEGPFPDCFCINIVAFDLNEGAAKQQ